MPTHTPSNPALTLALTVLAWGAAIGLWRYMFNRGHALVLTWAETNGYVPVTVTYRWFARGPYLFRSSQNQLVFHMVLRDRHGRTVTGYARAGAWAFGVLFSDVVDVTLDG